MKFHYKIDARIIRRLSGFTLIELMMVMVLMIFVLTAIILANLLGLKENQYMASKAGASNTSRMAINQMMSDIRTAKGFTIGTIGTNFTTGTNFAAYVPNTITSSNQGTALALFPILVSTNESINYADYILYVFDLSQTNNSNGILWRYSSTNQTATIVASNLINSLYFTTENYAGVTNWGVTYKNVIHTTLQFCEFQYPLTMVGSNYLFNYYRLDCRATPHLPDGP
jgi:Tfp pilus assembly protein PilW